jgi:O-antigen/teichoic acid export membrane protein
VGGAFWDRFLHTRSSLVERFARGVFWNVVAIAFGRGTGILSSIVAARLLGREVFGELAIVQATMGTFSFVSAVSMSVTATRHVALYRTLDKARAGRMASLCWIVAFVVGILSTAGVAVFSDGISGTLFKAPQLSGIVCWAAVSILFGSLVGVQNGVLTGLEAFKALALLTMLTGIVNLVLTGVLAWTMGLGGAVLAFLLTQIVNWGANSAFLKRELSQNQIAPCLGGAWDERGVLWKFSLPHVLGSLLNMPVSWLCSAFLARQPGGMYQMGLFSAAYRWRELVLFVPSSLSSVSAAMHAERLGSSDHRSVLKVLSASLGLVVLASSGVVVILWVLSPWILQQYGVEFLTDGVLTMRLILLSALLLGIGVPLSNLVTAAGKVWASLLGGVFSSATLITLAYSLTPKGAEGLAWANVGWAAAVLCIQSILCVRVLTAISSNKGGKYC